MDIKFKVSGQKLMMLTKYNKFVSDAKDFMCLVFDLPTEWSGYDVTAEFTQRGMILSRSLSQKRSVFFPSELSEGVCLLALRGSKNNSVVTTDSVALYIDKYIGSNGSGDVYMTVELSEPIINIKENGLVTAIVNQKEGYVVESSKITSLQLPVHNGGVVKPEKNNKIAVPSGVYTTGDLIISGDENLDPSNIRKGTTIFDVHGIYEGSTGMDLPEIKNPARSEHVAEGMEFINELGVPSVGSLIEHADFLELSDDSSAEIILDSSDSIIVTSDMDNPHDFIARSGVKFQSKIPLNRFGDADPGHVAEGAYFTSSEGFCIPGELKPGRMYYYAHNGDVAAYPEDGSMCFEHAFNKDCFYQEGEKIILCHPDLGDAVADDVVKGKTFTTTTGIKIEGNIVERNPETSDLNKSVTYTNWEQAQDYEYGGYCLHRLMTFTEDALVRKGSYVSNYVSGDNLGDATAENVVKSKTFTSASGMKLEGSMPNRGAVNATIDGLTITNYTIPDGYHNGLGVVSLTSDIEKALASI